MSSKPTCVPIAAADVPPRRRPSVYPEPFASLMQGRIKQQLGEHFGITNFGVNLTTLLPGGRSALRHAHTKQEEIIYVISGHPTLIDNNGETILAPGMVMGFRAGDGNAHHLLNRTNENVTFLEVGDRTFGDEAVYPDDDIAARLENGKWVFAHKDGSPY